MANIALILLVFAFVCATISAIWVQDVRGVSLGWASLAFYFLSLLLSGFK
jgi:hypothetical protein